MNIAMFKPILIRFAVLSLLAGSFIASANTVSEGEQAIRTGNHQQALEIFKPLAEAGDPEAMLGMGRLYEGGLGVEQNRDTAIGWFGKAVTVWNERTKKGDPRAYASLGIMFNKGLGFKKDRSKAREYFKYAIQVAKPLALQGDNDAQQLLGALYSSGKGVTKDIYTGVEWLSRSGEGGNKTAIRMLIYIFECGCRGLPKDSAKVEYWQAKLAAN